MCLYVGRTVPTAESDSPKASVTCMVILLRPCTLRNMEYQGNFKPSVGFRLLVVSGDRLGTSNPNLTPPAAWFRVLQEHRTRVSGSGLTFGFWRFLCPALFLFPFYNYMHVELPGH